MTLSALAQQLASELLSERRFVALEIKDQQLVADAINAASEEWFSLAPDTLKTLKHTVELSGENTEHETYDAEANTLRIAFPFHATRLLRNPVLLTPAVRGQIPPDENTPRALYAERALPFFNAGINYSAALEPCILAGTPQLVITIHDIPKNIVSSGARIELAPEVTVLACSPQSLLDPTPLTVPTPETTLKPLAKLRMLTHPLLRKEVNQKLIVAGAEHARAAIRNLAYPTFLNPRANRIGTPLGW